MNFGTLQSISKETKPTSQVDDDGTFEFNTGTDDGVEMSLEPEVSGDGMEDIADKLIDLKNQIEDILSYLGYPDEPVEDFEDFEDEDFDDLESDETAEHEFDFDATGTEEETFDTEEFADEEEETGQSFFDDGQIGGDDSALDQSPEDADFQGDIRTVAGANLVYKRKGEDGNFEELWIYNVGKDIRQEMQIRRAILAGTDIVPTQTESDDGTQRAETHTLGNVQYLKISGLPN